jgi:hypothetical protein
MKSASTQMTPSVCPCRAKAALVWALGLGLGVATTGIVNADNILFNGNLDQISYSSQINQSPTGWTIDAEKTISGPFADGADSESWCNV